MQYLYQDIQAIDRDGILLSDGFKISFSKCNQTWKHRHNAEDSHGVGERDITADPSYFRFFIEHQTIEILCTGKGLSKKRQGKKDFEHLRQQILQSGYTTFDMS